MLLEQIVHEEESGGRFFLVHEMESANLGFVSGSLGFFSGNVESVPGAEVRTFVGLFSKQVFRIENSRQIGKGIVRFVAG